MLGDIYPDGITVEGGIVCVEAMEKVLVTRTVLIHGGTVLLANDGFGKNAFSP
jgi:hypothetical protein